MNSEECILIGLKAVRDINNNAKDIEGLNQSINHQLNNIDARDQSARHDIDQLLQRADNVSTSIQNGQADVNELKNKSKNLSYATQNLREDIGKLEAKSDVATSDIEELKEFFNTLTSRVVSNEEELSSVSQIVSHLEGDGGSPGYNQMRDELIAQLHAQLDTKNRQIDTLFEMVSQLIKSPR